MRPVEVGQLDQRSRSVIPSVAMTTSTRIRSARRLRIRQPIPISQGRFNRRLVRRTTYSGLPVYPPKMHRIGNLFGVVTRWTAPGHSSQRSMARKVSSSCTAEV
jgi:hypothetical protein